VKIVGSGFWMQKTLANLRPGSGGNEDLDGIQKLADELEAS
jgi:hypothetical protein